MCIYFVIAVHWHQRLLPLTVFLQLWRCLGKSQRILILWTHTNSFKGNLFSTIKCITISLWSQPLRMERLALQNVSEAKALVCWTLERPQQGGWQTGFAGGQPFSQADSKLIAEEGKTTPGQCAKLPRMARARQTQEGTMTRSPGASTEERANQGLKPKPKVFFFTIFIYLLNSPKWSFEDKNELGPSFLKQVSKVTRIF